MGRGHVLKKQKILKNTHPMALSHRMHTMQTENAQKPPMGGKPKPPSQMV